MHLVQGKEIRVDTKAIGIILPILSWSDLIVHARSVLLTRVKSPARNGHPTRYTLEITLLLFSHSTLSERKWLILSGESIENRDLTSAAAGHALTTLNKIFKDVAAQLIIRCMKRAPTIHLGQLANKPVKRCGGI